MTYTLSPLEKRVDLILKQYHEDGIFPTKDGLFILSMNEGHYDTRKVEHQLLTAAADDHNHPFHDMVKRTTNSTDNE